jgi:hypothetical protein
MNLSIHNKTTAAYSVSMYIHTYLHTYACCVRTCVCVHIRMYASLQPLDSSYRQDQNIATIKGSGRCLRYATVDITLSTPTRKLPLHSSTPYAIKWSYSVHSGI